MRRYVLLFFMFNAIATFSFVAWWSSMTNQPMLTYVPEVIISPRRRLRPTIAETGDERQCVEEFLTSYEQVCLRTMHPNPDNIVVDANKHALLAALEDAKLKTAETNGDAWMSDEVDKMLCPCVPSDLGEFYKTDGCI
jgi:hypothetical protein